MDEARDEEETMESLTKCIVVVNFMTTLSDLHMWVFPCWRLFSHSLHGGLLSHLSMLPFTWLLYLNILHPFMQKLRKSLNKKAGANRKAWLSCTRSTALSRNHSELFVGKISNMNGTYVKEPTMRSLLPGPWGNNHIWHVRVEIWLYWFGSLGFLGSLLTNWIIAYENWSWQKTVSILTCLKVVWFSNRIEFTLNPLRDTILGSGAMSGTATYFSNFFKN